MAIEIKRHTYFIERYLSSMPEMKELWLNRWMIPVCWTNVDGTVFVKENLLENLSDEELLELMRITSKKEIHGINKDYICENCHTPMYRAIDLTIFEAPHSTHTRWICPQCGADLPRYEDHQ